MIAIVLVGIFATVKTLTRVTMREHLFFGGRTFKGGPFKGFLDELGRVNPDKWSALAITNVSAGYEDDGHCHLKLEFGGSFEGKRYGARIIAVAYDYETGSAILMNARQEFIEESNSNIDGLSWIFLGWMDRISTMLATRDVDRLHPYRME